MHDVKRQERPLQSLYTNPESYLALLQCAVTPPDTSYCRSDTILARYFRAVRICEQGKLLYCTNERCFVGFF
jgi:hypothetical protein